MLRSKKPHQFRSIVRREPPSQARPQTTTTPRSRVTRRHRHHPAPQHHRPSRRRGRHRRSYGLLEPYREDCGSGIEEKKKSPMTTRNFFSRISGNRARRLARDTRDNWRGKRDIEVVGESGYGRTAVDMVRASLPDGVVVGVALPELNGIETARQIPRRGPRRNGGGPCR